MEIILGQDVRDLIFTSGKGTPGGKDGSIIFNLADGTELIRFDAGGEMHLLGEPIPFEKLRNWLRKLKDPEKCSCSIDQLVTKGCACNGV